jgi:hypothetical protein
MAKRGMKPPFANAPATITIISAASAPHTPAAGAISRPFFSPILQVVLTFYAQLKSVTAKSEPGIHWKKGCPRDGAPKLN